MVRFLRLMVLALMVTAAAWFPMVAYAATSGAHFMSTADSINTSGALVVSWDEAGLGNENVSYVMTADAEATWACINGGGNHPQAANKENVLASVSSGGSFQPKNGRVAASLTAGPLGPGSFACPSGQSLVLAAVSYSNVVLMDTTNGVTADLPDVSATLVTIREH